MTFEDNELLSTAMLFSRGDWWFPLEGEDGKQGMDNLRFSTPCNPVFPFRQMYISAADRVGMYVLRTAGACYPALPFMLGLRCECELYGTLRK